MIFIMNNIKKLEGLILEFRFKLPKDLIITYDKHFGINVKTQGRV